MIVNKIHRLGTYTLLLLTTEEKESQFLKALFKPLTTITHKINCALSFTMSAM